MKKSDSTLPLLIEEFDLQRPYSVIEVATLASGCAGKSPDEKIDNALRLLVAAEKRASMPLLEKLHGDVQRDMLAGNARALAESPYSLELAQGLIESKADHSRYQEILETVARDKASGKINRDALIRSICKLAKVQWSKEYSQTKFLKWLKGVWVARQQIAGSFGTPSTFDEFQTTIQSGHRVLLINDEETASWIIVNFYEWILSQLKRKPITIRNSAGRIATKRRSKSPQK